MVSSPLIALRKVFVVVLQQGKVEYADKEMRGRKGDDTEDDEYKPGNEKQVDGIPENPDVAGGDIPVIYF